MKNPSNASTLACNAPDCFKLLVDSAITNPESAATVVPLLTTWSGQDGKNPSNAENLAYNAPEWVELLVGSAIKNR